MKIDINKENVHLVPVSSLQRGEIISNEKGQPKWMVIGPVGSGGRASLSVKYPQGTTPVINLVDGTLSWFWNVTNVRRWDCTLTGHPK